MFGLQTSNEYQPLTYVRRVPVYAITIYVALNVLGMFATAFAMAAHANFRAFAYQPELFLMGQFWTPLTCTFLNPPNFFFLFSVFFLYSAGLEVERFLGRAQFLKLLGLMLLVPPLVLMVWNGVGHAGLEYYGSAEVTIGMIIAFATIYPNLEMFGWITLKWIAFASLFLSAMQALASRGAPGLSVVLAVSGIAFGCVRLIQLGGWSALPKWPEKQETRPAARPRTAGPKRETAGEDDVHASIDPLLEKIAKDGLQSLTPRERAQLERARQTLLNKQ